MNRRSMLTLAAVVTALVLVLIAFVAPGLTGSGSSSTPTTAAVPPLPTSAPTSAAVPAQTVPTTAAAPAQTTSTTNAQTTGSYPVSVDQAGTLAVSGVPGATLNGTPTLVSYQGIVAYEVPLSTGMAYVDATTGQVIASFATNGGTTVNSGGTVQGGASGEDGEHEEGEEHERGERDDD